MINAIFPTGMARFDIIPEMAADAILKKFLDTTEPYHHLVREIRLFGSRARGDERPDSDYDILILVHKKDRQMIDAFYDGVMNCLLEFGKLISLKIYTLEQWNYLCSLQTPFSQEVMKEGILLGQGR